MVNNNFIHLKIFSKYVNYFHEAFSNANFIKKKIYLSTNEMNGELAMELYHEFSYGFYAFVALFMYIFEFLITNFFVFVSLVNSIYL